MELPYQDRHWTSADGLELHYRDYPASKDAARAGRPPVLCLHGLTRNARDFAAIARHLSDQGWRVIVPEMRGRGLSEYAKDAASYTPKTYVADVEALLAQEGIARFVSIGTSMGGLMTMLMAARRADRLAGALLNDIGPQVDPSGLARIGEYVGQGRSFPTWIHAARAAQDLHGEAFPGYDVEDWLAMAKRTMVLGQNGRITLDYDMAIAEPFKDSGSGVPPDLWPAFEALAGRPVTVVRGALSDLLSEATVAEMKRRIPDLETALVPGVGHAPTLDEPEARAAIDALLARVEADRTG